VVVSNPGSNLLKRARKLIKFGSVQYYPTTGRTMNTARQWVASFGAAETLSCSVQAVPRANYVKEGLDFNKFYVRVYAAQAMATLDRDTSGDRFIYNGDLYAFSEGENWFVQDGWATVLAVRIKTAATGPVL
jgi:hypothetical protein